MKQIILFLALTLIGGSVMGASYRSPYYDPDHWDIRWGHGLHDPYPHGRYYDPGHTHCSPDMVAGNIQKTDQVLRRLAASEEFRHSVKFRQAVSEISQMRNIDHKLNAYFSMLGIDARDNGQLAEFLGARRPRSEWLVSLERQAELSPRQADTLVRELSRALKGGLK